MHVTLREFIDGDEKLTEFQTSIVLYIEPCIGLEIENEDWGPDADSFVIDHLRYITKAGIFRVEAFSNESLRGLSPGEYNLAIETRKQNSRRDWRTFEYAKEYN